MNIRQLLLSLITLQCSLHGIQVQGHRGMRSLYPENSLPGFEAAIEAGVDAIELDLLLTQDEQIVIQHNYMLNADLCNYANGEPITEIRLISNLAYADVRRCDCGSKKNPAYEKQITIPGTHIPTLQELFQLIETSTHPNAKRVRLNLEIKADPANPHFLPAYSTVAEKIVQAVHVAGFSDRVAYSSFDPLMLAEVSKVDPTAELGLILSKCTLALANRDETNWVDYVLQMAGTLNIQVVSPDHLLLSKEAIQLLHGRHLRVVPWTVNELERCHELVDMGVDGVISDYPIDVIKALSANRAF